MRRGFHSTTSSYSSFNFLRAGCGVLTMNTSAHVTSSCRTCWALGDFRSRVMLRLLRLLRCHWYGSSARGCGAILCPNLRGSPFGGSTLMTSAPKSDRITAAAGPATKLEKSTTLSPEKMLSIAIAVLLNASVECSSSSAELRCALFQEGGRALLLVLRPGA